MLNFAVLFFEQAQRFCQEVRHLAACPDCKHLISVSNAPRDTLVELDLLVFSNMVEFRDFDRLLALGIPCPALAAAWRFCATA